ncbi:MAG TPA: alpha/beta hydrolase, partial [Gammaproteobacteria bacterium]
PQDASPAAQADAYICLLDALGIDQADVLAASAGAPSALQFALRHPARCKALVLLVPMLYSPHRDPAKSPATVSFVVNIMLRSEFLVWLAPHLSRATVEKSMLGTPPAVVERASPEEQARVQSMITQILPIGPRRSGLLNDVKIVSSVPRYELEQVSVPTLAISTADDLYGSYDAALYTSVHIAKGQFIGFASGGHMLVGDQGETRDAIVAFLQQGEGSDH